MSCCSLDVKDQAVCWKLLTTLNSQYVPRLDVSPINRNESFDFAGDHKILDLLVVDLLRHLPLPHLERQVSHAHQRDVD